MKQLDARRDVIYSEPRSRAPRLKCAARYFVYQIIDVHNVACGIDARHAGSQVLIDHRTACEGVKRHARHARKLILRYKANRKQQRIAGHHALCAGHRPPLGVDLTEHYRFDPAHVP